jgi:uncharacterized protein (TIGR04255 family)
MPFPESKRVVYQKNPLVEVICQLRFPTILEISAADPAGFQKKIRARYPLYSRQEEPGIPREIAGIPKEIADFLAQLAVARPLEDAPHRFLTGDSSRSISLTREFLAVADKSYARWEEFRREIELAKTALEEEYQPAFYSRIGLRYVDIIDKVRLGLSDESWDSLVNSSIAGILGAKELYHAVRQIHGEALMQCDDDGVPGGFARLRHGLVERPDGGQAYRIDADFFTTERSASADVFGALDRFNRLAGNFFRWAITRNLQDALEPREIG